MASTFVSLGWIIATAGAASGQQVAVDAYPEPPPLLTPAEKRARLDDQKKLMAELQKEARLRAAGDPAWQAAILREGLARIEQRMLTPARERGERSFGRSAPPPITFNDLRGDTPAEPGQRPVEADFAQPRISGGQAVDPDRLRDVVALRGLAAGGRCTGVRISRGAVLTAAHCFCRGTEFMPMTGVVVFGSTDTSTVRVPIRDGALLMPEFCSAAPQVRNGFDMAVVRFDSDAPGNAAVIMNPVFDYLYAAPRRLVVAGFGRAGAGGEQGIKLMAWVQMASRLCSTAGDCAPGRELKLADPNRITDTCPGDSGGPAFHVDGGWYLSGITSRGTRSPRDCGDGGIYTIVTQSAVRWLCGMGVVPTVHNNENPCGLAVAATPALVQPQPGVQPAPKAEPGNGQKTAGTQTPSVVGRNAMANYLTQCRKSCRDRGSPEWDCTEECSCRMLCEAQPQSDAAACTAFCAQRQ